MDDHVSTDAETVYQTLIKAPLGGMPPETFRRGSCTGSVEDDLLLPVLRQRWSPREFDVEHEVADSQVDVLLEAARWAPSAGNSQPWAFHATRRHAPGWADLVDCLAGSSRPWATQASLLMVNISHVRTECTEWEYGEFATYDLGQAVAHMTIQAHAMGMSCRQFRAFDKEALTATLAAPAHWEIMTVTAIGKATHQTPTGPAQRLAYPEPPAARTAAASHDDGDADACHPQQHLRTGQQQTVGLRHGVGDQPLRRGASRRSPLRTPLRPSARLRPW